MSFFAVVSMLAALAGTAIGLAPHASADAGHVITIDDLSVSEGVGGGNATVTLHVSPAPIVGEQVKVDWATSEDSPASAVSGTDYTFSSGTATFDQATTSTTVSIPITNDTLDEPDEHFSVLLGNPVECPRPPLPGSCGAPSTNATIGDGTAAVTIQDNDVPSFSIDDVTHNEGNSGTTTYTFTVTRAATPTPDENMALDYATADGSGVGVNPANAPSDYTATSGTLTFTPSDTTKTITVLVNGDVTDELDEQFFVNLSNPRYPTDATRTSAQPPTISDNKGVGTITNDDSAPTLAINDVSQAEGNSGTTAFTFTVTKTGGTQKVVTVDYATADGSATQPSDYASTSGTLTFQPADTTKTITVNVVGDTTNEGADETFVVNLSNAPNATISDSQGTGTIQNDDAPVISVSDPTPVTEGGTLQFHVHLTGTPPGLGQTATVHYATSDGTATAPSDYTSTSGDLLFTFGQTDKTILVPTSQDSLDEANPETMTMTLTKPGPCCTGSFDYSLGTATATGSINDDDGTPSLSIGDVTHLEGDAGVTPYVFTVTLGAASGQTVTVDYATSNGTATQPSDYTFASNTLTFAPGQTTKTITVNANGDTTDEPDETFFVNLSNATNATISDNQATGTIQNDDTSFAIDDVTHSEGNSGTTAYTFTVTKTGSTAQTLSVDYATGDDTATAPSDYTTASGTLTFAPGDTTKTATVLVNGDTTDEPNEQFFVFLSNATNSTITDSQGIGTINNDDTAPSLSIDDVSHPEGNAGTTAYNFTVSLSAASGNTVTVDYATADDSATQPSDYTAASGTLTFLPGQTSKQVTVNVNGDTTDEPQEQFDVNLTNPSNATIVDNQGVGTIVNDDTSFAINDVTVTEGNSGTTNATFTVTKTGTTAQTLTVDYGTQNGPLNGGATAPDDYTITTGTLTFLPGESTKTIDVPVVGDTLDEVNETFFVNLSNADNATITDDQGLGTITDDDGPPTIAISDVTQAEGNSGTTPFVFDVSLAVPSGKTVTVQYATADGTATQPSDYTATSGTLTFTPGQTSKQVTVNVNGDTSDEANETFTVNLSNPSNATTPDTQGLGTITNDDTSPSLSINDASVTEGNSGTTPANFTVSLSVASGRTVTVDYATADGTAAQPGDYTAASGTLTFLAGETSKQVSVLVKGDTTAEPNETFNVNLTNPSNATISDNQGVGTINNDDSAISIDDVSHNEGNSGTTAYAFTVSLNAANTNTVTVDYATADGTATQPSDYTSTSGTLTFAPGDTSKQVTVNVNGDTTDEANETFNVNLTNPSGGTIADNQGVGTITNDDTAPTISINDVAVTEGNSGTAPATFTVTLSAASGKSVTVDYATADGTATQPSDYAQTSGTLTFAPGETTKPVAVTINGDATDEPNETYNVNLTNPSNATISDNQGVGTINNDDSTISINDVSHNEGNSGTTAYAFTVSLDQPNTGTITVDYATADGTATQPSDYSSASGTLTFTAGQTSKQVTVNVNGDTTDEPTEAFNVNLTNSSGATITDNQGVGTVTNDDTAPTIAINDAAVTEGNSGTTPANFTVSLSAASGKTVTVDYATANGTATQPGDYTQTSGTLTFAPGETTKPVAVTVNGDTTDEANETFNVNLTNPSNATISDNQGVGTINNDDSAISIGDVTQAEGNSGTTAFAFTVSLDQANANTVTVDYATADGTATQPSDYSSASGTLTFTPGQTSKQVTVNVNGDTTDEANETFNVNLTNPSNATISDSQGVGTITNDDTAPSLSINDTTVTEGDSGATPATFTVTLGAASGKTVTVDYATADGTATQPGDYASASGTLTFTPGQTSKQVTVNVNGDTSDEPDETFNVNLTNPSNATISDNQGVGTITDDDGVPAISIGDATVAEGDSGTTPAVFTVSVSPVSGKTVTVDYATSDGTATQPSDYSSTTGTLTFTAGQTSKQVTVNVKGDTKGEPNETFNVGLTNPTNATIADNQGVGTITNDDPLCTLCPDFNGDDVPDVLYWNKNNGTLTIWYMGGTGGSQRQTTLAVNPNGSAMPGPAWVPSAVIDFDGDGKPDILYWNKNTGQTSIWYMGGANGNVRQSNVAVNVNGASYPGVAWSPTAAADFDGDGTPDILYWNKNTGRTSIWYMGGANGDVRQSNVAVDANGSSYPGTAWVPTSAADFDGDGTPDILYWNKSTGHTSIWYMGGANGDQRQSNVAVDTNGVGYPSVSWVPTAAADFDIDGTPDIFFWNKSTGKTSIWYMGGTDGSQRQSNVGVDPNGSAFLSTAFEPVD